MSLLEQLDADLKSAMLARDEVRKRTIRSAKTASVNALVDKRQTAGPDATLTDDEVLAVIAKQAKQRRDSIEEFQKAGRSDLVAQEQAELEILEGYLPRQLSEKEITNIVSQVIADVGATSPKDLGQVMRVAMPQVRGQADGKLVNQIARDLLSSG